MFSGTVIVAVRDSASVHVFKLPVVSRCLPAHLTVSSTAENIDKKRMLFGERTGENNTRSVLITGMLACVHCMICTAIQQAKTC